MFVTKLASYLGMFFWRLFTSIFFVFTICKTSISGEIISVKRGMVLPVLEVKYMDKYGIENVRGGSFSKVNLTKIQLACLELINIASNDRCFKCNQPGHFSSRCHYHRHKEFLEASSEFESADEINIESEDTEEYSGEDSEEECIYSYKKGNCYRCGREGHFASKCFAIKHIKGYYLK